MEMMLQTVIIVFMLFLCSLCLFAVLVIARDMVAESMGKRKSAFSADDPQQKEQIIKEVTVIKEVPVEKEVRVEVPVAPPVPEPVPVVAAPVVVEEPAPAVEEPVEVELVGETFIPQAAAKEAPAAPARQPRSDLSNASRYGKIEPKKPVVTQTEE